MDQQKVETTALVGTKVNHSCYGGIGAPQRLVAFSILLCLGLQFVFHQFNSNRYCFASICDLECLYQASRHQSFYNCECISNLDSSFGVKTLALQIHIDIRSTFIVSFKRQIITLRNKETLSALIVYSLTIAVVFLSGIVLKRAHLTLGFSVLEICAYIWYCFSSSNYSKTFVQHVKEHHQKRHPDDTHHHNLQYHQNAAENELKPIPEL